MVREKLKERMNPRLGKIDIDYQVLHDAFFKYQLKSNLTVFGDIYYEGTFFLIMKVSKTNQRQRSTSQDF